MSVFIKDYAGKDYDISTYGTDFPNYKDIVVSKGISPIYTQLFHHSDKLDPNKNTTIGSEQCSTLNLCVPSIHVPDTTKQLVNDSVDIKTGKPTDLDYKVAGEIRDIADNILGLPEEKLTTSEPELNVGNIVFNQRKDVSDYGYQNVVTPTVGNLPDTDFSGIAGITQPLVTKDSIACEEKTKFTVPDFKELTWKDKKFGELASKLEDLLNENIEPEKLNTKVTNEELTERIVDGNGTFDWIASALFQQLANAKNTGLINNDDIGQIYSQSLVQGLQIASQFLLERDKTYLANLMQLAQIRAANVQTLLAKAELLMLPSKLELAYAQLEVQKKQVELLSYQAEVQKLQIPKEAAETDHIKEQTALVCVQKKIATEQLSQSELDRKIKQAQVENAVVGIKSSMVDMKIKEEQAKQAEVSTQQALVQLEGAKEDVKIKNTQWQIGVKNIKLANAQYRQIAADIKLKAQQLLKDREHIGLIKSQAAAAYAQVVATGEAIKAAKAQYSDTIDGEVIGGVLGAQIAVNKMQAEAFNRDSFYKLATTIKDGWSSKKTADIATLSPNAFTALGVDRVFAAYTQQFSLPDNIFELPSNYRDYLSDAEMDGEVATPSSNNATVRK